MTNPMRKLILDYYRRWALVLVGCALFEFLLGCFIATNPHIFEFWALQTAFWSGAMLLSFDLRHGALRLIGTMPLTGRQIGRAFWLATVPIPAIVMATLLFAGATTFYIFNPDRPFGVGPLAVTSLFTFVWQGMTFAMVFNGASGFGNTGKQFIFASAVNWMMILVIIGTMVFCNGAAKDPVRSTIILTIGALLTAKGWHRAKQIELPQAGRYLGRVEEPTPRGHPQLTPLKPQIQLQQHHTPAGSGGISHLLSTFSSRIFIIGLIIATLILLIFHVFVQTPSAHAAKANIRMAILFSSCAILFFQCSGIAGQVRFLRTLPISTNWLTATLLALTLVPVIALGLAMIVVAWLLGSPAALVASQTLFVVIPAVLTAFIAVRIGTRDVGMVFMPLMQSGFIIVSFLWPQDVSPGRMSLIALASILVGFVLLRHVLSHSDRPYSAKPLYE